MTVRRDDRAPGSGAGGMEGYAWGGPAVTGTIRSRAEDFRVEEILGFEPVGGGEHLWLWVEKTGVNTEDAARDLAEAAGIHPREIGFAGLKDRHAVTRQWFSLHLPGRTGPDWREWSLSGIRILDATRSERKLRRGGLKGNRFELRIRDLDGDLDALAARLEAIRTGGVPNGFGEQRFGGNNIARAHRMFRGQLKRRPSRSKRGLYLSAARSLIFNRVLAARVAASTWNRLIDGDCTVLDGTRSFFPADVTDPEQRRRCAELDIHPSGPLAGVGPPPVSGQALAIELVAYEREAELVAGLQQCGLSQQRRALRARVADLQWALEDGHLMLSFHLGAGSYATAVLRELVRYD